MACRAARDRTGHAAAATLFRSSGRRPDPVAAGAQVHHWITVGLRIQSPVPNESRLVGSRIPLHTRLEAGREPVGPGHAVSRTREIGVDVSPAKDPPLVDLPRTEEAAFARSPGSGGHLEGKALVLGGPDCRQGERPQGESKSAHGGHFPWIVFQRLGRFPSISTLSPRRPERELIGGSAGRRYALNSRHHRLATGECRKFHNPIGSARIQRLAEKRGWASLSVWPKVVLHSCFCPIVEPVARLIS